VKQKPIKWIGTQRTAFTHRKKQKRIKEVVASTIANLKKTPAVEPEDDTLMEDLPKLLTAVIVKHAGLVSGLG
jgi:hypothetical protein